MAECSPSGVGWCAKQPGQVGQASPDSVAQTAEPNATAPKVNQAASQ